MKQSSNSIDSFYVVIPAAGVGKRMKVDKPKQYLTLAGKTLLQLTIERFIDRHDVEQVIVAIADNDEVFDTLPISDHKKLVKVSGGEERGDSVLQGLKAIKNDGAWVMVHDAARPCVKQDDIRRLAQFPQGFDGAILAAKVRDTMKRCDSSGLIMTTENRDNLWHALTPQLFQCATLREALETGLESGDSITDEASAMEKAGYQVAIVEGRHDNIKITHPEDLQLAEFYLTSGDYN